MARILTGTELGYQRRDGQRSRLYLDIHSPISVFTALVNGDPASDDQLSQVTYDGGSADFADVCIDQTVLVGTSAGAHDLGHARVRGNNTLEGAPLSGVSGTLYLGEISEIVWQDNAYLTILDEFGLWPRHIRITDAGVIYMDYDLAYVDQHTDFDPVPVMGPHAIKWLPKSGEVIVRFDASASWALGETVDTWAWTATGCKSIAGDTTATPTITYDATGRFRVDLEVTVSGTGKVFTGRRYVRIFDKDDMPATQFTLDDCRGSFESRGWSFSVTMFDEANLTEIRDRAMVILFAEDWYGSLETSIGPIISSGNLLRANILAVGWIAGESIRWNPELGSVSFEVQGPQFWLSQMPGFPSGLEDVAGVPATWIEASDLTDRIALFHFFHYCSTASRMMDLYLYPDTTLAGAALSEGEERQIAVFNAPPSNLLDQAAQSVFASVRAHITCDRYGRMFAQRDLNEIPVADRTTGAGGNAPAVQTITTADWRDAITIQRRIVTPLALLDSSGVAYKDASATALFSLSPGHVFRRYGDLEAMPQLALWTGVSAQALANALCGLIAGKANNEYPVLNIPLAGNYRGFDIAPWQYASLTIASTDTERGITESLSLIPRGLSFSHDPVSGVLLVDGEFEASTTPQDSRDGDVPPEPPDPPDPPDPPPGPTPPVLPSSKGLFMLCSGQLAVSFNALVGTPTWYDADPNSDLVGGLYSVAVHGLEAWITTRNDAAQATTGLWYCADISAAADASIAWTLIKSVHDAVDDGVGYLKDDALDSCCFGALDVNDAGEVGALIHSTGNRKPQRGSKVAGMYIGSGGSVTMSLFGNVTAGNPFFQETATNECLHSVWGKGGDWYVAGRDAGNRGYLAYGPAWTYVDFGAVVSPKLNCVNGDVGEYAVAHGKQVYENWDPAAPIAGLTVEQETGIWEDDAGGHRIYIEDDTDYDLYQDDVLIGDASTAASGFGTGRLGSMAQFVPGSTDEIVWIVGNGATFGTHRAVIYSDDGGANWLDKTGNLAAALGAAAWNGWGSSTTANSIVRVFEH